MKRFTVAVLVRNEFGVLNRVTSMFRRRQFNIRALTVSETETNAYSRITVVFEGEDNMAEQLINQLYKLPDVCAVRKMRSTASVSCELMLIKMKNREEICALASLYNAEVLDSDPDAVVFKVTGESAMLDEFVNKMRDFSILEMCRTGVVSLERGGSTIKETVEKQFG